MSWEPIQVAELPYLDASVLGGRTVPLMPYWDGTQWHLWAPTPQGLQPMQCGSPIASNYVAKEPERSTDLFIPFVDFLRQHSSWSHTLGRLNLIEDDVHNLGTSFAKFEHFYRFRATIGGGVALFAATELEYLFLLSRSLLDLCYDLFRDLWNKNVRLGDEFKRPPELPSSLSSLVLTGNRKDARPRDAVELESKYELPLSLAGALVAAGAFLAPIRRARDGIAHQGARMRSIYDTERGFCVNKGDSPFSLFDVWKDEHRYNENLVTLIPLVAHLVFGAINICNVVADGFAQQIKFLPPIAPGFRVFTRGYHNEALGRAMEIALGGDPWPKAQA